MPDLRHYLGREVKGLRIGVPTEYFVEGIEPDVKERVEEALLEFERLGCEVDRTLSLPMTKHALAVYYLIAPSEASSNLARYDGIKYGLRDETSNEIWKTVERTRAKGFGEEVKRRIMLGTYALSAGYYDKYYLKAQQVRTLIIQEFNEAFKQYDLLVTPTTPSVAFPKKQKINDPYAMYLNDIYTLPSAVAGLPALSMPCGIAAGLPVGLQIIGNFGEEGKILQAAHAYEQTTGGGNLLASL